MTRGCYRVRGWKKQLREYWIRRFEYEYPTFSEQQIADRFGVGQAYISRTLKAGRYNLGDLPPKRPENVDMGSYSYCKLDD